MQFLTWAIPSGGIGAAIAWIANRKVKQAESAKQIHDTYKTMYQDISNEWIEAQQKLEATQRKMEASAKENAKAIEDANKENQKTRYALNRLSRAIEAIQLCPHRASCPVSGELQNQEDGADLADGNETRGKRRQQRKPKPDRDPDEPVGDNHRHRRMDGDVDDASA